MTRIGLVADTHGLVRPEALAALRGVAGILHAGDVGGRGDDGRAVLAALGALAPVTVVRGNNDRMGFADVPTRVDVAIEGVLVHVVHDVTEALPGDARVVVSGHSHRPGAVERDGKLWVNPGSCGPRRFALPISVGVLVVDGTGVSVELVELR